jgi:hypothetical protein
VEFVARRGYEFSGRTTPLSGDLGSKVRGLDTAEAAAKLIGSKWSRIQNAVCDDGEQGGASQWKLIFGPVWHGERRVVGFDIRFAVDARVQELIAMFEDAKVNRSVSDPPALADPLLSKQKEWESSIVAGRYIDCNYGVDEAIECLREGGNPFDTTYASKHVKFTWDQENAEMKSFMDLVRREVGPGPGWHVRISPFLTDAGIEALRARLILESSTPKAKSQRATRPRAR